tara:strand:- start:237 stop:1247 length:1011 start_codon:yes stop_codon:yes gene_type:complete
MASISNISVYLPERTRTNQEISNLFPEWEVEKIANKTGIESRHISAEHELSSDMAISVGLRFFEEHEITRDQIDFLIICTQSPDYNFPNTACLVQDALGLSKNVGGLDYVQGCSGYIYGLALATSLVDTGIAKNLLLITSETITKFINKEDKGNLTLFGDAASATLVSSEKETKSGVPNHFVLGTDGSGGKNIIMHRGAMRNPDFMDGEVNTDQYGNVFDKNYLYMDGPEVFKFTLNTVPKLISDVLAKSSLSNDDIDLYIFHQANGFMLEQLRKVLRIPKDKFHFCLRTTGNTVASSIPIALKDAQEKQLIKRGSKILLAAFGTGYSWGACILEF